MIRLINPDDIGGAIRDLRALTLLTQADLAREGHDTFSKQQVSSWETGRRCPTSENLIRLANAFGYDIALIPREGES